MSGIASLDVEGTFDPETGTAESHNRLTYFNPADRGALLFAGNGNPSSIRESNKRNFGPRIGFAYRGPKNTVFRAGYGIFYLPLGLEPGLVITPFNYTINADVLNPDYTPRTTLSNPFPGGIASPASAARVEDGSYRRGTFTNITIHNQPPGYQQQWNAALQKQFGKTTVADVTYMGSRGVHLPIPGLELNQIHPDYLKQGGAWLNERVPNPYFGQFSTGLLAAATGKEVSNTDGTGVTDAVTLDLAITAANRITHEILEGLSTHDLRAAYANALTAHPAGILKGVDHQWTGRVDRVDVALLETLLKADIIPVVPPLGCDGDARTYRLNSDTVAVDVARALHASKLIYLAQGPGVTVGGRLQHHLNVDEAAEILKSQRDQVPPDALSKLEQGMRAARMGVPRVHIIDGREQQGLLAEVFSNEGIGTLIHANEYQAIRKALKKDVRAIHALIQAGVESDELLRRSRAEIERQIDDFYLFEVDRAPAGCCAMHKYPEDGKAEVACVFVDTRYENQGIGLKLVRFTEEQARGMGFRELFCLSTQAVNYFVQKGGFAVATPDSLPPSRREQYDRSGRMSRVLVKKL